MATKSRVSEAIARPTRTALQGTPAWVITEFADSWLYDMSDRQYGAAVLLLTMIISYIQTTVENRRGVGFMRDVPPTTAAVVDGG